MSSDLDHTGPMKIQSIPSTAKLQVGSYTIKVLLGVALSVPRGC